MSQQNQQQAIICEECGLLVHIANISQGQKALCPRCGHLLTKATHHPCQRVIACAIACLMMLVLSIAFPFMSFSVQGITQEMTLLRSVSMLLNFQNPVMAVLLLGSVIVLPAIYIAGILSLYLAVAQSQYRASIRKPPEWIKGLGRTLSYIQPWLMVDVFLIGILVSLVKIASLAEIVMGPSFWAFCVYTVLLIKCLSLVDRVWLWNQLIPESETMANVTTEDMSYISCHICHKTHPVPFDTTAYCTRCGGHLSLPDAGHNLQKAWAFLLAAVIFYLPANLYPIMYTVSFDHKEGSTIMQGVTLLWHHGSYPIAMVIFIASVFIPMAKMLALAWLFFMARRDQTSDTSTRIKRLKLYRITEFIGRWSMIDIFVVAILVALVQVQNLMAVYPGPATYSFAAVVILTMLSAMTFDSKILWQTQSVDTNIPVHPRSETPDYE